jgi:hypothetical protein
MMFAEYWSAFCLLAAAACCRASESFGLSRDLGTSYKAAFVLAHKLREAMAEELRGRMIGGEGKTAEIDGEPSRGSP